MPTSMQVSLMQRIERGERYFPDIAHNFRYERTIPQVEYTEQEISIWNRIFTQLRKLYPKHACREYNRMFKQLEDKCGFRENNIPQLFPS